MQPTERQRGPGLRRGEQSGREVIHTTLLDLLLGIDEIAADEAESLATALRLLRGGRVRLVGRASELDGAHVIPREHLRRVIRQLCTFDEIGGGDDPATA